MISLNQNNEPLYFQVVFLGAGGNGSPTIRNFLQDCRSYLSSVASTINSRNYFFTVTLVDGDKVERKNMNNQIFIEEDIEEFKVDVLADRYGDVYDLDINSVPEYIKTVEEMKNLFPTAEDTRRLRIPILVGSVDNNRTRQMLDEFFHDDEVENLIYLDSAVEETIFPEGKNKHSLFSDEEKEDIDKSGWSGQVVCGLKWQGKVVLPPVARVYDNILVDSQTSFPGESCGDLIQSNPQRSATNRMAAQTVNIFLNNLLHGQTIFAHEIVFHARYGGSDPTYVNEKQVEIYNQLTSGN